MGTQSAKSHRRLVLIALFGVGGLFVSQFAAGPTGAFAEGSSDKGSSDKGSGDKSVAKVHGGMHIEHNKLDNVMHGSETPTFHVRRGEDRKSTNINAPALPKSQADALRAVIGTEAGRPSATGALDPVIVRDRKSVV